MSDAPEYTFGDRDYLKFMPVVATDQFKHRRHLCPICGWRGWSVWANADKHWQKHGRPQQQER
jgi:hypothetical protein